ncbi:MAG: hypothetical protein ACJAU2_000831 [Maribacter sp.]|jgi:hypothetical protein
MKKIAFVSGVLGASLILGGLTGELMHWEYNGTMTVIGAFIFLPSVAKYIYGNGNKK